MSKRKSVRKPINKIAKAIKCASLGFDGSSESSDYRTFQDSDEIFCYLNQKRLVSFSMGVARKNTCNPWIHHGEYFFPASTKFFLTRLPHTFQVIGEGWNPLFFEVFFRLTTCRDEIISNFIFLQEALDNWLPQAAKDFAVVVKKLSNYFQRDPRVMQSLRDIAKERIINYKGVNEKEGLDDLTALFKFYDTHVVKPLEVDIDPGFGYLYTFDDGYTNKI